MPVIDYQATLLKLIDTIQSEYQHAMFITMDEICYGSIKSAEQAGVEERRVKRLLDCIPKEIMDRRRHAVNAAKAAKLRRQADELEKST
jgi:hypothetical protein